MKKRKLIILLLGFGFGIISAFPQQVVSSSGDFFINGSGSVAFTIGESVTQTFSSSDKILTQGMHQAELIVVPSISKEIDLGIELTVFPNPTSEFLTLKTNKPEGLSYFLYSLDGKILESKSLKSDITTISFGNLFPSTYILRITDSKNSPVQSFTIFKN